MITINSQSSPERKTQVKALLKASSISFLGEENIFLKKALISKLNSRGFNLIFHHRDLVPSALKFRPALHSFWDKSIHTYIPNMEMDLEGRVTGTRRLEKGNFEVNIEFSQETPSYWRECLFELWTAKVF